LNRRATPASKHLFESVRVEKDLCER